MSINQYPSVPLQILPYAEGEMATVHNIIVDDEHKKEPKEAVAVVAHWSRFLPDPESTVTMILS